MVALIMALLCLGAGYVCLSSISEREATGTNIRSGTVALWMVLIAINLLSFQRDYVLKQQNAEIIQLLKADTPTTVEATNGR